MTARWVVDVVAPERDLSITWQPISLLEKNQPDPDSEYYAASVKSHGHLRVMEALREAEGDEAAFQYYWECATRMHHDRDRDFAAAEALAVIGAPTDLASAYEDDSWDVVIKQKMDEGLALTGTDVGTPLIAFDDHDGERVGLFGPVITRVPNREQSLALWDGFVAMGMVPGFWEVKRTRTQPPEFGDRPS